MSKRYPGNFITGNPVALTQTSNNGVWDLKDQYHAQTSDTWQEVDGVFEIGRSLRFRNSASAHFNRTPTVTGNRTTWTLSAWVKLGSNVDTQRTIFGGYSGTTNGTQRTGISIYSDGTIAVETQRMQVATDWRLYSTQLLRDPTAWYHLVVAINTNNAASQDRLKIYLNGEKVNSFGTIVYPSLAYESGINSTGPHYIGRYYDSGAPSNTYADQYLTEMNFIDGEQLDPSYFGRYDPITNIWQPKRYTGKYGVNGFYLPFRDIQTVQNLSKNYGAPSNYLPATDQLTNGTYWANQAVSLSKNVTDPFGVANNAYTLTVTAPGYATVYRINTAPAQNMQWCQSIYVKTGNINAFTMGFGTDDLATAAVSISAFNANTGGFLTGSSGLVVQGNATNASWGSKHVGNGWYRVWISGRFGATTQLRTDFSFSNGTGATGFIYGPQLNLGTEPDDTYLNTSTSAYITDWTPNNFSLTAGATYDSMVDSPVNVFTSATDVGGVVSGNYCTIDPNEPIQSYITYSNANLSYAQTAAAGFGPQANTKATFQLPKTGKWVWAITIGSAGNNSQMGIARPDYDGNPTRAQYGTAIVSTDYTVMNPAGGVVKNGTEISTSSSIGVGDELQCAVDCDIGTVSWYRNGTYLGQATGIPTTTNDYWPMTIGASSGSSGSGSYNFGQRPFAYAPPAGFKTLNTTNLQALGTSITGRAALTPNKWIDATLYGGTGVAPQKIINDGKFAPDLVWLKARGTSNNHHLSDNIRGPSRVLYSNLTNIEATDPGVVEFHSDGFTVSGNGNEVAPANGQVAWQWKQSPTSGFNIVSYTGNGANNRAISHNLGVAPEFIIVKDRDVAYNWDIYHKDLGIGATLIFTTATTRNFSAFGSTAPNSSNFFTQNSFTNTNTSKLIAYLWTSVPGFSKFGYYTGSGNSDGPLVNLGFKPKWLMIKNTTASEQWAIIDTARFPYNDTTAHFLPAQSNGGEDTNASYHQVDFISNGFKVRGASQELVNYSGHKYVYAAFAESPFGLNNRAR